MQSTQIELVYPVILIHTWIFLIVWQQLLYLWKNLFVYIENAAFYFETFWKILAIEKRWEL